MSVPYDLTPASFQIQEKPARSVSHIKGRSVRELTALAVLESIAAELRVKGYDVTSPGLGKGPIASFSCCLPLVKIDLYLTAYASQATMIECKLEPLGWSRKRVLSNHELLREWEQLRSIIDEHLSAVLNAEYLRWSPKQQPHMNSNP